MTEDNSGGEALVSDYRQYLSFKILILTVLLVILLAVFGFALTQGSRGVGFIESYQCIIDQILGKEFEVGTEEWWDHFMVWNIQMPRAMSALVVGAGLAVCGCVMQAITRNPLADPYTTGMTSGAEFGVAVAMVMGFSIGQNIGQYGLIVNAFVFGMVPALFIIAVTRFKTESPATIILAGIAISYLFNAMTTLLLLGADAATIQEVYLWQLGTLEKINWNELTIMAVAVAIGIVFMFSMSKNLNLLSLGTGSASTLGLDVGTFRVIMLLVISLVTATIVSFSGIIGFLGLVAPHMMRMIIGGDNRFTIPSAALAGAAILLIADTVGRTIVLPYTIPVGVVMSFIGAPIFLALIIKMKREVYRWGLRISMPDTENISGGRFCSSYSVFPSGS